MRVRLPPFECEFEKEDVATLVTRFFEPPQVQVSPIQTLATTVRDT